MSYITKKGREAVESAMQEDVDATKALVSLNVGSSYKIRIASKDDFAEWMCHSVFGKIRSTPCTKPSGVPDLYDKAVDYLYNAANEAKDTATAEELRTKARQLRAKPRYLFGFFNLADGSPCVVDLSKAQAQAVSTALEKYVKKLDTLAFELSKTGSGTSATVTLSPIIDEEELTAEERKNFEATAGKAFPEDLFEKVLYVKSEREQIQDLKAFGFDVSLIGITDDDDEAKPIGDEELGIDEDDLPF